LEDVDAEVIRRREQVVLNEKEVATRIATTEAQEFAREAQRIAQQAQLDEDPQAPSLFGDLFAKTERAKSMAQMTKAGHVYIVSNIGSFGEGVYKIGVTRRIDPMGRIKELNSASVPFNFDVHGMIWSEDAPALEAALHAEFDHRRVNLINRRKEFFHLTISELDEAIQRRGLKMELTLMAEAHEFRKSQSRRAPLLEDEDEITLEDDEITLEDED
jgi:hypothetical protein